MATRPPTTKIARSASAGGSGVNTSIQPAPRLTLHSIQLRVVSVPLRRPIVSNPTVGKYTEWPFILVDLLTNEGITGRSYLEPYIVKSADYILPAIQAIAVSGFPGFRVSMRNCSRAARDTASRAL